MRNLLLPLVAAALVASPFAASSAQAQKWKIFKSDRFGFAMLVAPGTAWKAADSGDGWGGIRAQRGTLEFAGIVKLKAFATPQQMGASAEKLTGVPRRYWTQIDKGSGKNGWKWWQTYRVRNEARGRILFAVIGTGPRGSYLLLLGTTIADFEKHQKQYQQWYRTLTLY